ncbi:ATP-dependent helicase/deoxyribonuclease subunit B [Clostridium acetireducens DSM 10703]|uniref:ATP-dependent helicase/deoxyribonuclease subunit B n=1 Tax=Clostridium acetireducens DSM 10703 TaxID=1121290 RepID=A0A1E8EXF2_9CLOT|nr:helicase-exonuclease AddAB subunit AddB [Clostridium acetireducens]OFI05459.1 ATP-dependent helicase/deoxyribonuclease subunit B [Clostridium acetireducens DSM 10703]
MSLKFIYGRSGSGKSYYCLQDIKKKIESGVKHPLILLVPEQFSFQAEKNLIHTVGDTGIPKAEVLSFKRMAYKVFNEVGGITHKHMNPSGRSMLIYKIIEENKDKLKLFGKASKRQGFVTNISDVITEFKRYNVENDVLKLALENIKNENLKNKMEDIFLIYNEFEKRIYKKYIDTEDDLTILAEKLDESNIFQGAEIWIDGFFSFTPQEYKILEKILKKSKVVNITLSIDNLEEKKLDNVDVFMPTKVTEEKLLKIARDNNIKYDKPIKLNCEPCYRFKNSKELHHLEKYMFSFPYKTYNKSTKDICLYKALNKYTEIENTARDIISKCRDKAYRFNDIAVITGDLDGYENLVRAIFNQYNIPYFIDKKRPINNNPLIVLIVSMVEIFSKNWSYEAVFKYLKTGLTPINNEDIDIIENYVLANGIKGYKWIEEKPWDYKLSYGFKDEEKDEEDFLNKVNEIRYKIIEPLKEFYSNIVNKKTARDMCEALYNFLNNIKVSEKIEGWIKKFKIDGKLDIASEYNQIWNIVVDILDQIVETIGEENINSKQFAQILITGFAEYEIGLIPPSLDQVLVSSIERLRSHNIKILYVIGVNDGIFPMAVTKEGIITDSDRENLREKGLDIAEDTRNKAFEDQFLMYITLTTMSDYLRLSYPIANHEGKTLRSSIVISRIKKVFPHICEKSDIVCEEEELNFIVNPKSTFNKLISAFRKDVDGLEISDLWKDVYCWYRDNDYWSERLNSILEGLNYSNYEEVLDSSKVRKLYGRPMNISVSRLEKYAECPFAYFIKYGIKGKERRMYKISSPDMGIFMHEVLEEFSKSLLDRKISWYDVDKSLCSAAVSVIVDEKIASMPKSIFNSSARYKYMSNTLKRILTTSIYTISKQINKGGFKPIGYEIGFGINEGFPPISVELHSGEKVRLIGKIDRIDALEKESDIYLRIIDYKSSSKDFKLEEVYYGIQLQLLIYLDSILTEIESELNKNVLPAGILYFKMDDPIIKTKGEISEIKIEEEIIKSLKMRGILLSDTDIIKEMDKEIKGNSLIIPARVNKDGSLGKSSAIDLEHFNILRKYVKKTIANLCEEMLEGNICIRPYKKKDDSACKFCEYSSICQFDTEIEGNQYRLLKVKDEYEVWSLIEEELNKEE